MKVQDQEDALSDYLERTYQERIENVEKEAARQRERIIGSIEDAGRQEAERIVSEASARASEHATATVSRARQAVRREQEQLIEETSRRVLEVLTKEVQELPEKHRQAVATRMHRALTMRIAALGEDPKAFAWRGPKGAELPGAENVLEGLRVEAESDDLFLEDGVSQRLAPLMQEVTAAVKQHLEDAWR